MTKLEKKNGKYIVSLTCVVCGKEFGEFTIGEAIKKLPICNECLKKRRKIKRGE